jgi:hypothetical protein
MERFYDPRRNQENTPVKPGYDPAVDSGSSGADSSDLHPEHAYDTDIRRLDTEDRQVAGRADTQNLRQQERVKRFLSSARAAGKYQQHALVDEPQINGNTPRTEANIKGTNVPTLGDTIGTIGSVNYARKPKPRAGLFRGF